LPLAYLVAAEESRSSVRMEDLDNAIHPLGHPDRHSSLHDIAIEPLSVLLATQIVSAPSTGIAVLTRYRVSSTKTSPDVMIAVCAKEMTPLSFLFTLPPPVGVHSNPCDFHLAS